MSIEAFFEELDDTLPINPLNHNQNYLIDNGEMIFKILLYNNKGKVHISELESFKKGGGKRAIKFIKDLSDKYNVELELEPVSYNSESKDNPMNDNELEDWYRREGFEWNGYSMMIRKPVLVQNVRLKGFNKN